MELNKTTRIVLAIMVWATVFVIFFGIGYAAAPTDDEKEEVVTQEMTEKVTEPETATKAEPKEATTATETEKSTEGYDDLKVDITVTTAKAKATPKNSEKKEASSKKSGGLEAEVSTAAKQPETTTAPTTVCDNSKPDEVVTEVVKVTKKGPGSVKITDDEYDFICCLVYGEAGAEPYEGQVLVAQCFYNAMAECECDAYTTAKKYGYTGSTRKGTNESVKKAVAAVFYDGYRYTNETVLFFYSPSLWKSGHPGYDPSNPKQGGPWHESQTLVCEVGGHRFFKRNGA